MKMFRYILAAACLFCSSLQAATGDITNCIIDKSAFVAYLKITGVAPGGTYTLGPDSSPKAVFTVTSLGFDATGAATTKVRTVYGRHQMLCPTGDGTVTMSKVQIGAVTGGIFADGDTVTQPGGATAVVDSNCPCSPLLLRNITGSPNLGAWTDSTTGATATPTTTPTTYTGKPNREGIDGSDIWIAVSLSRSVYQKDNTGTGNSGTAPTVTVASGLYNDGTNNSNAVTALTCTNQSTLAYPQVIAGWCIEGGLPFSTSVDLEMQGYHNSAGNGQPIACVVFSAADAHSHTKTGTVSAMSKSVTDGLPVYKYTINAADFTQSDPVICNFIAYPIIGDSGSILDTSTGPAWPQFNATGPPALGPQKFFANAGGTYGTPVVVVDPNSIIAGTTTGTFTDHDVLTQGTTGATCHVTGNQTTGPIKVSLVVGSPDANSAHVWTGPTGTITPSAVPVSTASGGTVYSGPNTTPGIGVGGTPGTYSTYSVAVANAEIYNNTNNGRNNADGVILYMLAGDYGTGDSTSVTVSNSYCTITRFPGVPNGEARIIGYLSLNPLGPTLMRYYDLDIDPIDDYCISDNYGVWVDHCRINGVAKPTALIAWESARHNATYNTSINLRLPFITFGGGNYPVLLRGNNCANVSATGSAQVVVGNIFKQDSSITSQMAGPGAGDGSLFAFNSCQVYGNAYVASVSCTHGIAFVSNLIEKIGTDTGVATSIFADGNTAAANHVFQANNTIVGERSNTGYSDELPNAARTNWYCVGNVFDWCPIKSDAFNQTNASEGPNPERIGNWPVYYGTNFNHNHSVQLSDPFPPIYFGLDGTRQSSAGYTLNASESGTNAGNGNYTPSPSSSLVNRVPLVDQPLSFDLAGNKRGFTTAIGAFVAAAELNSIGQSRRPDSGGNSRHPR